MTREEKIKEAAQKYVGFISVEDKITLKDAFKIGAEWALANQWFSVADGDLPKDDELYLCSDGSDYIIGEFDKKKRQFNNPFSRFVNEKIDWVKYWMEIPQLPKKGGNR